MGFVKNNRGQMAIFVALFFQVIFVFFAMAINVGLVIHDKINLQNAVDLAAYYGATKQAEVLNHMAHINYQMRQNYKLFVWRYRVFGTMGNFNSPLFFGRFWGGYLGNSTLELPGISTGTQSLYPEENSWDIDSSVASGVFPTVCISHALFAEPYLADQDAPNYCSVANFSLPPLKKISGGAGFISGASDLPLLADLLKKTFTSFCEEAGELNFLYASRILASYRVDGFVRKQMIKRLRANLSNPNPLDLRNEPIQEGVRTTFRKNLTDTNFNGIENFTYFNSLQEGQCASADGDFWLPEILITPVIMYSDWKGPGEGNCTPFQPKPNRGNLNDILPWAYTGSANKAKYAGAIASSTTLQKHWQGEPSGPDYHSSIGFEKNPWCMVYTGVSASTVVRKPFSPSGSVRLKARGFAKPFGGRMGPWYGKTWSRGSGNSISTSRDQMVDPLLPAREVSGSSASGNERLDVANHSRYPGDEFGMSSKRAISAMIGPFMTTMGQTTQETNAGRVALGNYNNLKGQNNLIATGDGLARYAFVDIPGKGTKEVPAVQRPFELAATAPDVFDALYYSIEPAYYTNYFTVGNGKQFDENNSIYDFGSVKDGGDGSTVSGPSLGNSVMSQIATASGGSTYMPDYTPVVRNWQHLLNSWHQKEAVNYELDPTKFGRCAAVVSKAEYPNPGNCIVGGRTGYSVKNISMDYLESGDHAIGGGAGGSTGALLNPPPTDF